MRVFRNRRDAGRQLAARLAPLGDDEPVVLGLPRGGVPVAAEVAEALGAPLDVIVVRKLGVPFQPELGMGAVGEDGVRVLNDDVVRLAGVSARRGRRGRGAGAGRGRAAGPAVPGRPARDAARRADGGRGRRRHRAPAGPPRAACEVARAHGAARVVLAVPVAPPDVVTSMREVADDVVCLETPGGVLRRRPVVRGLLADVRRRGRSAARRRRGRVPDPAVAEVTIPVGAGQLAGQLAIPAGARGVVVFAHGSGSSRHSPRNRYVADALQDAGLGTLLFDLLTPEEEIDRPTCSTSRSSGAGWRRPPSGSGAADDAAAADRLLRGEHRCGGGAVGGGRAGVARARGGVSRRPARPRRRPARPRSRAPTLLVVGGHDDAVLELNREAAAAAALRAPDRGRPRRDPPLRGARHARGRRPPRRRLVPRPPLTLTSVTESGRQLRWGSGATKVATGSGAARISGGWEGER